MRLRGTAIVAPLLRTLDEVVEHGKHDEREQCRRDESSDHDDRERLRDESAVPGQPDRLWRSADPKPAYDVIIVGGGNAALCAALMAREAGADHVGADDLAAEAVDPAAIAGDKAAASDLSFLLLEQALILDGELPEDPAAFANRLNQLVLRGIVKG